MQFLVTKLQYMGKKLTTSSTKWRTEICGDAVVLTNGGIRRIQQTTCLSIQIFVLTNLNLLVSCIAKERVTSCLLENYVVAYVTCYVDTCISIGMRVIKIQGSKKIFFPVVFCEIRITPFRNKHPILSLCHSSSVLSHYRTCISLLKCIYNGYLHVLFYMDEILPLPSKTLPNKS